MKYCEFKRQLGKAGLKIREFAQLIGQSPNSVTNYSSRGTVPDHLAVIAVLMGEMADAGLDFRAALTRAPVFDAEVRHKRGRGGGFTKMRGASFAPQQDSVPNNEGKGHGV